MSREQPTTTVVFFLGGCTYTEIAALRWVGRQSRGKSNSSLAAEYRTQRPLPSVGRKIVVATTGIISGASLIESLAGVERTATNSKDAGLS